MDVKNELNSHELKSALNPKKSDKPEVEVETSAVGLLLYRVWDVPPLAVSLVFALQICLQLVSVAVTNSILISTTICGNSHVTAKLMSTNMFMAGLTSAIQATVGVRLPVFQGPSIHYVVPLLTRAEMPDWACEKSQSAIAFIGLKQDVQSLTTYAAENNTVFDVMYGNVSMTERQDGEEWRTRLLEISGVLMVVSIVHAVIGASGLGGEVAKIIGPLTVVPMVVVLILKIVDTLIKFTLVHVGVTFFTLCILLFLSTYLANVHVPVPIWTPAGGVRFVRSRFLRTYAVLISIGFGWFLCYILTVSGALTDDPDNRQYQARTDSQLDTLTLAKWFYFPYPGQFGMPRFSLTLFFGLFVAMLSSVVDSLADYNIVSKISQIPKPTTNATNRGLLVEGLCSILSGAFGAGISTSTNIAVTGSLAISGVTSRRVFQFAGVMLMLLGVVGKIGAFFVIIPKPVVGAVMLVILGSVTGVLMAELHNYDMKKPRNGMTVGLSILLGYMIPKLILNNQGLIDTGNSQADNMITAMFGTPLFVAGIVACLLDNTLPGRKGNSLPEENVSKKCSTGEDAVHRLPYVHDFLERQNWTRFCPFLPGYQTARKSDEHIVSKTSFELC